MPQSDFKPRPKQREILKYRDGWMGIAAVPGAGKTRTLSELASLLLLEAPLKEDQEILIVTLVNAAANNFARQIRRRVEGYGLIAGYNYRVRTLHGLANDIVSERPGLVGLSDGFTIIDERETQGILSAAVEAWLRGNPDRLSEYWAADTHESKLQREVPVLLTNVAGVMIRQAKDWLLTPEMIFARLAESDRELPLVEACAEIYRRYQTGLSYRGGVDFQDLIRLALKALQEDPSYLERLRHRWAYILEDEAQDSSELQEQILRLLAGNRGNWVRVGDPNQAIYETFTTANPKYLREFLRAPNVQAQTLPNSGRCQPSIIELANFLIDWGAAHPVEAVQRREPLNPPFIEPTPPNDPQPNPPNNPAQVVIYGERLTPQEELEMVARSVKRWLQDNPTKTAAVLVPRNQRGVNVAEAMRKADIPYVELLQSTQSTRAVAGSVYRVMRYLANPFDVPMLAQVYQVYQRDTRDSEHVPRVMRLLKEHCTQPETFLSPQGEDWLDTLDDPELRDDLEAFRVWLGELLGAAVLPVDQLVLTIAQRLFTDEVELATAYALSLQLRRDGIAESQNRLMGRATAAWSLAEYAERLAEIAKNERKFFGLDDDEGEFNPDKHAGKVTISTVHRAKGLEWDRVYLISVNNYDYPADEPHDNFYGEKWFVVNRLNLEEEARAQLEALRQDTPYHIGQATLAARADYAAERLRLLYVGVTRAREDLIVTWNAGKNGEQRPAAAFTAMQVYWEQKHGGQRER